MSKSLKFQVGDKVIGLNTHGLPNGIIGHVDEIIPNNGEAMYGITGKLADGTPVHRLWLSETQLERDSVTPYLDILREQELATLTEIEKVIAQYGTDPEGWTRYGWEPVLPVWSRIYESQRNQQRDEIRRLADQWGGI